MFVTPIQQRGLGLVKNRPDSRDFALERVSPLLPAFFDLRSKVWVPPPRDQGRLGSCTAFAATALAWMAYLKAGWHNGFRPSELFQYYYSRLYSGDVTVDGGASIRDAMKVINKLGITAEAHWPYDPANVLVAPPPDAAANALRHTDTLYFACNSVAEIKASILQGYGVQFGMTVYERFEERDTATTGVVTLPVAGEQSLGGHSMWLLGWDDASARWLVQNSWGSLFGAGGYMLLPYDYPIFDMMSLRGQR